MAAVIINELEVVVENPAPQAAANGPHVPLQNPPRPQDLADIEERNARFHIRLAAH